MSNVFDSIAAQTSAFSILGENYPTIAQGDRSAGVTTYVLGSVKLEFIPNDIRRYNFPDGVHILGQAGLGAHRGTTWDLQVACDQGRLKIYGIAPGTIITDGAYYDSCWYRAKDASGKFIDNSILGSFIDDSAAQWNREHAAGGTSAAPNNTADVLRALSLISTGMADLKSQVSALQVPQVIPPPSIPAQILTAADNAAKGLADRGYAVTGGGLWVIALRNLVHTIKSADA